MIRRESGSSRSSRTTSAIWSTCAAVGRRPAAPLDAVDGSQLAVLVRPFVPDRDAVLPQPAHVRVAAQEPEELVRDRLEVHLLRRHEGEALGQVEAHLVAERAQRPGSGAVALRLALGEHVADEVLVLGHAPTIARSPAMTRSRNRAASCGVSGADEANPPAARAAGGHVCERGRRASAAVRAPVRRRGRAGRDDLVHRPLARADHPAVHGTGPRLPEGSRRERARGACAAGGRDALRRGSAERADPAHPTRRAGRHRRDGARARGSRRRPGGLDALGRVDRGRGRARAGRCRLRHRRAVRRRSAAARRCANRRRRLRRPRRARGQPGRRHDGSRDPARESRRVQGRRRQKRRRVRSDGRAERGSGRPHLAERSRRARGRDGPARPTPRRPGARSADAPERVALAPDGSLLVAQIEPVPAIRRVNLATGRISTIARST